MPTSDRSTRVRFRCGLAAALVSVAAFTTAYAQLPPRDPGVETPPQLKSLVDSSFTVTISYRAAR